MIRGPVKFLIVGLGNPGPEYQDTRHNIGFRVVEALADAGKGTFRSERYGEVCEVRLKGRQLVLLKPSTFMNLSGRAVRYWADQESVPLERTLVVTDDIALPFGKLRLRAKGGAGGHNGLSHIIETLGTEDFPRLRFGVGNDFPRGRQADFVLSPWDEAEREALPALLGKAADAVRDVTFLGLARAMNQHNSR